MVPEIKFERFMRDCRWNETAHDRIAKGEKPDYTYDFKVLINGEHRATLKRLGFKVGYELVIVAPFHKAIVRTNPGSVYVPFTPVIARSQADFLNVITDNLDLIPTLEQTAKIIADHDAEEKRKVEEEKERTRVNRIKGAGPEMLELLKHWLPFIVSEEDDPRQQPWVERTRVVIDTAEGR